MARLGWLNRDARLASLVLLHPVISDCKPLNQVTVIARQRKLYRPPHPRLAPVSWLLGKMMMVILVFPCWDMMPAVPNWQLYQEVFDG